MTRLEANLTILETLKNLTTKYPDLRFGQLLAGADVNLTTFDSAGKVYIRDSYYEESEQTLNRMYRNPLVVDMVKTS